MKKKKERKEESTTSDNIILKECNCSCLQTRSPSFFDLFLASSVKESEQYEKLVREREQKKRGGSMSKCAAYRTKDGREVKIAFEPTNKFQ